MLDPILNEPALLAGLAVIAAVVCQKIILDLRDRVQRRAGKPRPPKRVSYARTMVVLWLAALACLVAWLASGRGAAELGLGLGEGWRALAGWGAAAAVALYLIYSLLSTALSRRARTSLRRQFADAEGLDLVRPASPVEHRDFQLLSVTAGITEEIVFRGFLISVLALALPLWLACLVSIAVFVMAHLYQGTQGMLRILPITVIMTLIYVGSGLLWPAILVHVLVDATAGGLVALVDAFEEVDADQTEAVPA
jgi:membrane protease YdiL (CAAX protease family)